LVLLATGFVLHHNEGEYDMVKVEYIAEKDAPAPPKVLSKTAAESLRILQGLKDGHVAKVTPDADGQTLRGLKASFSRVAKNNGLKIQSYEVADQPGILFVRKSK
jgi:hypothetical protein